MYNNGYNNVYEAENGVIGIEKYNDPTIIFDIIFMDVHMPVMNGLDAIKIIRQTNKEIPIIIITADVTDNIKNNKESIGFTDYVNKPVVIDNLLNIITKYCPNNIEQYIDNKTLDKLVSTMDDQNEKIKFFNDLNIEMKKNIRIIK